MKKLLSVGLFTLSAASLLAADFRDHLGLQLYSLRAQTKESTTGALDIAKSAHRPWRPNNLPPS
jgi:hypothetical protein